MLTCIECSTTNNAVRAYLLPGWAAPVPLCSKHIVKKLIKPKQSKSNEKVK